MALLPTAVQRSGSFYPGEPSVQHMAFQGTAEGVRESVQEADFWARLRCSIPHFGPHATVESQSHGSSQKQRSWVHNLTSQGRT